MKKNNNNLEMQLQTKVSPEVYARLESICTKYGFTRFQLLRMLADTMVRFMDDRHNLSEDLVRAIRMFENIPGWGKSICLADDGSEWGIVEAFYVVGAKGKDGFRLLHTERPLLNCDAEGWKSTFNVQTIIERFMEIASPSLYKHLRALAVDMGTESLFDVLHTIVNLYKTNPDEVELRRQFEDNSWHRGGQTTHDTVYVRHKSRSMSYLEQSHPELFPELLNEEPNNQ